MDIKLIRHATLRLEIGGRHLLLDPALGAAGMQPPIENSDNDRRNPLVDLPAPIPEIARGLQALVVTHLHRDHLDDEAVQQLPHALPVFCQPEDADALAKRGFKQVQPVADKVDWEGLEIIRTGGRHGTGDLARQMGPVSGFVFRAAGERPLYVAGDTVWCPLVADALARHKPGVIVVNAGAAEFVDSDPITMDSDDVLRVAQAAPEATVVAVHMEAWNHCALGRSRLAELVRQANLSGRIRIPQDGQQLSF
ncbi:MAG TPA: MBL fold metallo-hydrolase [Vicinamibacterales bacterium]|nr:MBL fold metallo-hydrolase [Vicinamibacterales bacterium]